jgi:hypothetical protein
MISLLPCLKDLTYKSPDIPQMIHLSHAHPQVASRIIQKHNTLVSWLEPIASELPAFLNFFELKSLAAPLSTPKIHPSTRKLFKYQNIARFYSLSPMNLMKSTYTSSDKATMTVKQIEYEPSSNNYYFPMADYCNGIEYFTLPRRSTAPSASNNGSIMSTLSSSSGSETRQQSSKSSVTSTSSWQNLLPTNSGQRTAHMPNIDLLHIGAQFSPALLDAYGHIDNEVVR